MAEYTADRTNRKRQIKRQKDTEHTTRGDLPENPHGAAEPLHIRQDRDTQDRYGHKYEWDAIMDGIHKHDTHHPIPARVHRQQVNTGQNVAIIAPGALTLGKAKENTADLHSPEDQHNMVRQKEKDKTNTEKEKDNTRTLPIANAGADQNTQKDPDEAKARTRGANRQR